MMIVERICVPSCLDRVGDGRRRVVVHDVVVVVVVGGLDLHHHRWQWRHYPSSSPPMD
jgi:hypothetical protein